MVFVGYQFFDLSGEKEGKGFRDENGKNRDIDFRTKMEKMMEMFSS